MKGIQFVINENGEKTAVVIDLKKYRTLWEDFEDAMIAESRSKEPRESIKSVRQKLRAGGELVG